MLDLENTSVFDHIDYVTLIKFYYSINFFRWPELKKIKIPWVILVC